MQRLIILCSGLAIFLVIVTGCQNPYTQFYTSNLAPGDESRLYPHTGETQFVSAPASDTDRAAQSIVRRGYGVIGSASFEAGARDYGNSLRAKAKEVQADIVLVSSEYARTQSGVMPLVTYQPGQTSTTYNTGHVNATAYGTRGFTQGTASYSGTSTTTTSGTTQTSYIPYNIQRNTYTAVFFRKVRVIFGALLAPLSDEQRRQIGRNTGLIVDTLIEGSPAFLANILPGDILIEFDGKTIVSRDWFNREVATKGGQEARFSVLRDGTVLEINVRLNPISL